MYWWEHEHEKIVSCVVPSSIVYLHTCVVTVPTAILLTPHRPPPHTCQLACVYHSTHATQRCNQCAKLSYSGCTSAYEQEFYMRLFDEIHVDMAVLAFRCLFTTIPCIYCAMMPTMHGCAVMHHHLRLWDLWQCTPLLNCPHDRKTTLVTLSRLNVSLSIARTGS